MRNGIGSANYPWTRLSKRTNASAQPVEGWLTSKELDALIEAWTQERDRDELVSSLQGVGVAAGMALSDKDLTKDPHLRETGYFHSLERRYAGVHEYPRAPIRLSRSPQQEPTAAPTLGQYNEYVLSDILGFTKDELQEMRTDKVIGERLSDA